MPVKKKATKKKPSATKKKTSKKKATRSLRSRGRSKKIALVCASPDQCFWTTDGRILSNLIELHDTLGIMADEVFEYHVSSDRNDFADWVGNVLQDPKLEKALRRARRSSAARTVVARRLKIYDA
jgi:hypothetical protein